MGQEASLPENAVDASLEEQARAPPSATPPQNSQYPTHPQPQHQHAPNAMIAAGRSGRKLMGVLRGNNNDSTEQQQGAHSGIPGSGSPDRIQQQGGRVLSNGDPNSAVDLLGGSAPVANSQHAQHNDQLQTHQPVVGVLYEKTPPRKGLFQKPGSGRGAAFINSMRNLSLGGRNQHNQVQKPKGTVSNWEQQWDEDDDSDGDEPEVAQQFASMPLHQQQQSAAATETLIDDENNASTAVQPQQPNDLLWDSSKPQEGKPTLEMFLPMLRVLGKGSFGKVRSPQRMYMFVVYFHLASLFPLLLRWYWYKNALEKSGTSCLQ